MATEELTSAKKAAAVIVALGAERASEVYKYLTDEEVEQLSLEIAKLDRLSPEDMQATVEDFYGLCITQKVINEGGVLYAKDVLEKAFGPSWCHQPRLIPTFSPGLCHEPVLKSSSRLAVGTGTNGHISAGSKSNRH